MLRFAVVFVALILSAALAAADEPKQVLLIGQAPDGHPPGTHEFMADCRVLAKLLESVDGVETKIVKAKGDWKEGAELIRKADCIVLLVTQGARWMQQAPRRYQALAEHCERGGGLVAIHWSVGAHDGKFIDGQVKLLGGSRGGPQRKYTNVETDVTVADHPITRGVDDFRIFDEFYYSLDLADSKSHPVTPLLTARLDGKDETVSWAWERPDGGRSFGFVMLHYHKNWSRQQYRRILPQAVLWTLKLPVPDDGLDVDIDPTTWELK